MATSSNTTPSREVARDLLARRQQSYRKVFEKESIPVEEVLIDLMRFCRRMPGQTTFDTNQKVQDLLTGRQEVFDRITNHLGLSLDDLFTLLGGK